MNDNAYAYEADTIEAYGKAKVAKRTHARINKRHAREEKNEFEYARYSFNRGNTIEWDNE